MRKIASITLSSIGMLLLPGLAQAQTTVASWQNDASLLLYVVLGFSLLVALIVLAVCVLILQMMRMVLRQRLEEKAAVSGEPVPVTESWWSKLWKQANDAVPIEKEATVMLDHNYDGIRELDNHLPPWWKWLFYATIVFGFIYVVVYHVTDSAPLQTEEYAMEMRQEEERLLALRGDEPASTLDESSVAFVEDRNVLANAQKVYNRNCAQCHKETGAGGIGPNLTDQYWLHGGSVQDIFKTIKYGVTEKGMVPWEGVLSPEQMQGVASYIMTLAGTNPANPKAPQGDLYVPPAPEEAADSTELIDPVNEESLPADAQALLQN